MSYKWRGDSQVVTYTEASKRKVSVGPLEFPTKLLQNVRVLGNERQGRPHLVCDKPPTKTSGHDIMLLHPTPNETPPDTLDGAYAPRASLSSTAISDPMIEPTHPVIFRVFSPPPHGLELEHDSVPVRQMMFRRLIQDARESGIKDEEHDTNLSRNTSVVMTGVPLTDTSKMHMGDSVARTLAAEGYSATRQSKTLNFGQKSINVLLGAQLPLPAPATSVVPATSNVTHPPPDHLSNSMRVCTTRSFCKHQKAIRSRDDCVSWFSSLDSGPIETPPPSPDCYSHALQGGDLFIHTYSHGRQAWMWGELGWMPVQEGQSHPHIAGYYLSIARSGEPSWVTGKTMATYRAKNRKCLS
ncbi:hypothetical protein EDD15DRAFT_2193725 [Pisolithus albus]|nr:hypothetical protein EDD15DRAFT_2193725 [Pisolithus albus]